MDFGQKIIIKIYLRKLKNYKIKTNILKMRSLKAHFQYYKINKL